jgi:hypothetical protein
VEPSNSITLSEIEDALASTEHTNHCYANERGYEDKYIETVDHLLGATFEAEVSAAVAVDREKVNNAIHPSTMTNHIPHDVSAWTDLVTVVDQWVESQRRRLLDSSSVSGEPTMSDAFPTRVADKELEQLVPLSIPVIGTIFVPANLSQERRQYLDRLYTENSASITQVDSTYVPIVNHTVKQTPETKDDHTKLRESLGLPLSKESSLSSSPSRRPTNDHTTRSYSTSSEEARRTPKRFVDVRDTDKLAALLRGVSTR